MRELYPSLEPYDEGRLRVSDVHELYYEQCGNPEGKPVVFIHGGPGGGTSPEDRRFFDPAAWRVVLFHQRGCGKSTPHADLRENTTWHLVGDIEKIREHLNIEKWSVFGGSWGSTLGLAYAETHPDRVLDMVLRGIFMLRRSELMWFYQDGASRIFPDVWENYIAPIPEVERHDLMSAFYRRLTSDDAEVRLAAAKAWSVWEGSTSKLVPDGDFASHFEDPDFATAFARIECHYFVHGGFFRSDEQLLEDVHRLRHIPARIIQGRYDVVCPMKSAWDLHRAWPEAHFECIDAAGHNSREPGILDRLIEATDAFRA